MACQRNLRPAFCQQFQPLARMGAGRAIKQSKLEGDGHCGLVRLAGRIGHRLLQNQRIAGNCRLNLGCACHRIPVAELGQILAARLFHRADEVLACRRCPIMPVKVEIAAFAEGLGAQHRVEHADDLRAFVVDGRRIEIGDLHIAVRTDRVREWTRIFGELRGAQDADIFDPLDRFGALIGGETLIAEDREAFLQAQLEPVPTGDAIARPIVKIFMRNDTCDIVIINVSRGLRVGQHIARVEDVEALILHRAKVEIGNSDDVELAQIIFAAIDILVPFHARLQRIHRMVGARQIALSHPNGEVDGLARQGGEAVAVGRKIPRDKREQIARLEEGVSPFGPMAPAV